MAPNNDLVRTIEKLAQARGIFHAQAYLFVLQAIELAMARQTKIRHISGEQLLEMIRDLGRDQFGPMAGDVFNSWGVRNTLDFGRIVFHLVDADLLHKRDQDSLADFLDKFDFQEEFSLKVFQARG